MLQKNRNQKSATTKKKYKFMSEFFFFFFFYPNLRGLVPLNCDSFIPVHCLVFVVNVWHPHFPCTESTQNWPYLPSSCFSPLAAHWFTNTVQTHFSVLQLPQTYRSCLLNWPHESLQTNSPATLVFWYFHSLSSLSMHALAWSEIFFLCCTVCLEQSPLQS